MTNPVFYFEIPVTDMDSAVRFYTALFGFSFDCQTVDGYPLNSGAEFPGRSC